MLKSVPVSRHGPRSIATTSRPESVSSCARMAPVQPSPMITTSLRGRIFTISRLTVDRDRATRIRHIVLVDMVAIVVTRAREAHHLPARHALVAAIERIGKEPFYRVLQHQIEEAA